SCVAVTTNTDSCDLALVDMTALNNMGVTNPGDAAVSPMSVDNVVHRVIPTVGKKPLGASPSWIEIAPDSQLADPTQPGSCLGGPYRAWVAMPGCELVAEVDLGGTPGPDGNISAEVVRALHVDRNGATVVSDLSTLSCPGECAGSAALDFGAP